MGIFDFFKKKNSGQTNTKATSKKKVVSPASQKPKRISKYDQVWSKTHNELKNLFYFLFEIDPAMSSGGWEPKELESTFEISKDDDKKSYDGSLIKGKISIKNLRYGKILEITKKSNSIAIEGLISTRKNYEFQSSRVNWVIKNVKVDNFDIPKFVSNEQSQLAKEKSEFIESSQNIKSGIIQIVDGSEFEKLLKLHQKRIIEINRDYIEELTKLSEFVKTKYNNIQLLHESVVASISLRKFNQLREVFEDEVYVYQLIVFNSLSMISSLVEDDMITFYKIHGSFDKLNIFNSNWENQVAQKLSNIDSKMDTLIATLEKVGQNIVEEIATLSYVTEESTRSLNGHLEKINSSIDVNNLLGAIQTYQQYKINRNTKGLA